MRLGRNGVKQISILVVSVAAVTSPLWAPLVEERLGAVSYEFADQEYYTSYSRWGTDRRTKPEMIAIAIYVQLGLVVRRHRSP